MFRSCTLALVVVGGGFVAEMAPAQAAANDYNYTSWLNPRAPRVGTNYALFVEFRNNSGRAMIFRTVVNSVPAGDQLISPSSQARHVAPGGTFTFRFDIYC